MTLLSYFLSDILRKKFKEPVLLEKLLRGSSLFSGSPFLTAAGWFLHYSAGIVFVIFYHMLWNQTTVQPDFLSGGLLGLASGCIGVVVWMLVFKAHHNPPAIDLSSFSFHLIIVHILFGIGAAGGYLFFREMIIS